MRRLNNSLPAEQVECDGAEEHRNALLMEEMKIHQLSQRTREIRFQELHASTSDCSTGLEKERGETTTCEEFSVRFIHKYFCTLK